MRSIATVLLITALLLAGCHRAAPPDKVDSGPLWQELKINWTPEPLDLPSQPISVKEVARFTTPDGFIWPTANGEFGRTVTFKMDDKETGEPAYCAVWAGMLDDYPDNIVAVLWNLTEGTVEFFEQDMPIKDGLLPPFLWVGMPASSTNHEYPYVSVLLLYADGESKTRKIRIDNKTEQGLPILTKIDLLELDLDDGAYSWPLADECTDFELSATDFYINHHYGGELPELVFNSFNTEEVTSPDGVIHLVPLQYYLDKGSAPPLTLEKVPNLKELGVNSTFTGLCGSTRDGSQFLGAKSMKDDIQYIWATETTFFTPCAITVTNDFLNVPPASAQISTVASETVFSSKLPVIGFNDTKYCYSEQTIPGDIDSKIITAFNIDFVLIPVTHEMAQRVIWRSTVPEIFAHTEYFEIKYESHPPLNRPYLACLDQLTGDLTIFDPLMGTIRSQQMIERSTSSGTGSLLSFCPLAWSWTGGYPYYPTDTRNYLDPPNTLFMHDPASNEIIQLQIELSDSSGPGIRVLD